MATKLDTNPESKDRSSQDEVDQLNESVDLHPKKQPPTGSRLSDAPPPPTGSRLSVAPGPYDPKADDKYSPTAPTKEAAADRGGGKKTATNKKEDDLKKKVAADKNPDAGLELFLKRPKNKKGRKNSLKKRVLVSLAASLIGSGIIGFGVLSGPLRLISFASTLRGHFSSIENFTDDRTSRFTTYRRLRKALNGAANEPTGLERITDKFASRWEDKLDRESGIRPAYDKNTGRMVGFEITDEKKAKGVIEQFEKDGRTIENGDRYATSSRKEGSAIGSDRRVISLRDAGARTRRTSIRTVVRGLDVNRVGSAVGSRTLIRLAGVNFHPLGNLKKRAGEKLLDFYRRKKEARQERTKNGADPPDSRNLTREPAVDEDGNAIDDPDGKSAVDGGNSDIADAKGAKQSGKLGDFKKKFAGKLTGKAVGGLAAGAAAILGVVCAVKAIGEEAEQLQLASTLLPMMRIGFEFISLSSQIKSWQFLDLNEINYYASLLYDKDKKVGAAAAGAAAAQFEKGHKPTGQDIPAAVKPDNVNGKPALFRGIDAIPGIGTACSIQDAADSLIGKIPIIGNIKEAAESIVSKTIDVALKSAIGVTTGEFLDSVIDWLVGEVVDPNATGALLANYAHYGVLLASNLQFLGFGGRKLSFAQFLELKLYDEEIRTEEKQYAGLFERYLSLDIPDSLASTSIRNLASLSNHSGLSLLTNPFSVFGFLIPKTHAQETYTYDYGFNKIGFSRAEAEDPLVADPFENANIVEANFEALNEEYGECSPNKFTMTADGPVVEIGSHTDPEAVTQFNRDPKCEGNGEDLLRYRAYTADTMAAKSLACYEGSTSSCDEISFNQGAGGGGSSAPPVLVDLGEKAADTSHLACPSSPLLDGESIVTIANGNKLKLCHFGSNIRVNASWAPNVAQMLEAIEAAGIQFGGGGFRTAADQIRLRTTNGCPDVYTAPASSCRVPTARPGSSNHELALAIDFSHNGKTLCFPNRTCPSGTNPLYDWLVANSETYGITKLRSEAWHFSVDGR